MNKIFSGKFFERTENQISQKMVLIAKTMIFHFIKKFWSLHLQENIIESNQLLRIYVAKFF